MEDNQPQPTSDESLEALAAKRSLKGLTREQALHRRWKFLLKHPATTKIFHLLQQRGEMYKSEIAKALAVRPSAVDHAMTSLTRREIIEIEQRGSRVYYRIRPGMVEQYQQWLEVRQEVDEQPMHLQLFALLSECGEMDYWQLASKLGISLTEVTRIATFLHRKGFINAKHQKGSRTQVLLLYRAGHG
jgi:transcription initiation factor IIE alpha subunit